MQRPTHAWLDEQTKQLLAACVAFCRQTGLAVRVNEARPFPARPESEPRGICNQSRRHDISAAIESNFRIQAQNRIVRSQCVFAASSIPVSALPKRLAKRKKNNKKMQQENKKHNPACHAAIRDHLLLMLGSLSGGITIHLVLIIFARYAKVIIEILACMHLVHNALQVPLVRLKTLHLPVVKQHVRRSR